MARPLRVERAGGWYHLTARGNERRAIYRSDRDRVHFLELIEEAVETYRWRMHGYVLMDNHYHLLVQTPEPNLSRGMQWLQLSYAAWFNRRHERCGHLYQGRFTAVVAEPDGWAVSLSRYVHLNPVRVKRLGMGKKARRMQRAGVDEAPDPAEVKQRLAVLRRYRWSSYRAYIGRVKAPEWLDCEGVLRRVGPGSTATRRRVYREQMEKEVREGLPERPWGRLVGQVVLGGVEFVRGIQRMLKGEGKEQPSVRGLRPRASWEGVVKVVEELKGERWEEFRDRQGDWGRDLALWLGRLETGMKLNELGNRVGGAGLPDGELGRAAF